MVQDIDGVSQLKMMLRIYTHLYTTYNMTMVMKVLTIILVEEAQQPPEMAIAW